jgi:tetratricopeptide (TPR) repeat protein
MKGKVLLLILILVIGQLAAADSWSTFESKEYRIVFQYPSDWVRDTENEEDFSDWDRIVAFKTNVLGEEYYARMDVSLLKSDEVSDIQIFLDGFKQGFKDVFQELGGSATFLSQSNVRGINANGHKLEFKINAGKISARETLILFFRKNGIYVISFSCDDKEFSKYDKIQKKMTSFFEFYKEQAEIDTIFQTAKNNIDSEKWDMALKSFEEAKFHYARIDSTQLVKTCEEWIAKVEKVIEAQELTKKADELFNNGNYEEAKDMYGKVKNLYVETGMPNFV